MQDSHAKPNLPSDLTPSAPYEEVSGHGQRSLGFHLFTLFLFTKSDFKTVIFPQSIFAIATALSGDAASPQAHLGSDVGAIVLRIPQMVIWLWIHLLVLDVANQRQPESIAEDTINKPWRPLPSGRLSQSEALRLLRVAVPAAAVIGVFLGAFTPSAAFTTLAWLYNDLEGSSAGPILRNVINAAGLCCLGWGGHDVLTGNVGDNAGWFQNWFLNWTLVTAAMIATTVHAQDLPDMKGDQARDRKTLPLVYGERVARWSLAVFIVLWSVILPGFCHVGIPAVWWLLFGLGTLISALTTLCWRETSDKLVWNLWCVWATGVYLLPLFR
ncbi:hypothetical protein diail_7192 [Diaporthe ilicicola]|nr:hypothetical protein diail_7192 [Diaporthe ilicicola]